MAILSTKEELRQYIKIQLGSPVINVEVADIQLNNIIDDVIQDFQRYNYGEGAYLDYIVFSTSAYTSAYSLSGLEVSDVVEAYFSTGITGINQLFSAEHILLQERGGNSLILGHVGTGASVGLELTEYDITMNYLEEIKRRFSKEYQANYLPGREELRIIPAPTLAITGLLTVYRRESWQYLINNSLIKKLCIARTKILWGNILRKYSGFAMPGGATPDGNSISMEGKEEERELMEQIKKESEPVDFYIY
jgi:hypothetical protein